jgi:hypothetical protein
MSLGFFTAVAWNDPNAVNKYTYEELWHNKTVERLPICSDTDNCIFVHGPNHNADDLKRLGFQVTSSLGSIDRKYLMLDFKVENEAWHECTCKVNKDTKERTQDPYCTIVDHSKLPCTNPHYQMFSFAKKFYLLKCGACGQTRAKNKGHRKGAVKTSEFGKVFDVPASNDFLIKKCLCDSCSTRSLMKICKTDYNSKPASSGEYTFFKKTLARSVNSSALFVPFTLEETYCERVIKITEPFYQRRCLVCNFLVHK